MVSLDVVNLFTKVPIDETITVVRDKLATDTLLGERICIPVDNLMEMLTFCMKTILFGVESDIPTRRGPSKGISIVPSIGQYIHEILRRNDIKIYITKAINVA